MQRFPDPNLRSLSINEPPMPGGQAVVSPSSQSRSDLIDRLPTLREATSFGFTKITVPTGLDFTTSDAWYPLVDLDVKDDYGQELLLTGVTFDMVPTENTGATVPNINWGDGFGAGAAIVIGTGLPITGQSTTWVGAPSGLPSFTGNTLTQSIKDRYVFTKWFPTGNYADATPAKQVVPRTFSPFVYRFPFGSRVQVALVVKGSYIVNSSGVDRFIRTFVHGQLHLANTKARAFNSQ